VDHLNRNAGFLGKVVAVVLFGSMLRPDVERVSDVDLAVEIAPKEANPERARVTNKRRSRQLESLGHRFRGFLDRDLLWRISRLSASSCRGRHTGFCTPAESGTRTRRHAPRSPAAVAIAGSRLTTACSEFSGRQWTETTFLEVVSGWPSAPWPG